MDAELRQFLEAMEGRISDRFTAVDHRFESIDKRFESIDKRFENMDKRFENMDKQFETLDARLNQRIESLETHVHEHVESIETKLLTAFYEWARPMEMRIRVVPTIDDRVGMLEERVSRLERGDKPPRKN